MSQPGPLPAAPVRRIAAALRSSLRERYDAGALRADLMAGIVVGVVALPLSMALAIASGVPPQHGLYTAIVAGGIIALLGGGPGAGAGPPPGFLGVPAPPSQPLGGGGLVVGPPPAGPAPPPPGPAPPGPG